MQFVRANGTIDEISRESHPEEFAGSIVHLGALGIVTSLSLEVLPTYGVRQRVYERLPFEEALRNFELIAASAYSVSLFTDWRSDHINQVWLKETAPFSDWPESFCGAAPAPANRHPIGEISPVNCTEQMAVVGPWHERLPHFRMEFTPSSGEELQAEYLVGRADAAEALRAIHSIREQIVPHLLISEIRTIAADDLWLSPSFERDSVAIHFTLEPHAQEVRRLLPVIEEVLAPFGARPHWGKLFTLDSGALGPLYPKMVGFRDLVRKHDPDSKFRNAYLDSVM